ncbi:hypothetical protein [Paraburkholderia tropica]|uniref:hypothetical protein n=1 Tax=Paraburkholderia tropica TaxID=92647 RepID=UPI0031D12F3D
MSVTIEGVTYQTTNDALEAIVREIEGCTMTEQHRQRQLLEDLTQARREYTARTGLTPPDGPFQSRDPSYAPQPYIGLLAGTDDTFVIIDDQGKESYRATITNVPDGSSPLEFVGALSRHVSGKVKDLLSWQKTGNAFDAELAYLRGT